MCSGRDVKGTLPAVCATREVAGRGNAAATSSTALSLTAIRYMSAVASAVIEGVYAVPAREAIYWPRSLLRAYTCRSSTPLLMLRRSARASATFPEPMTTTLKPLLFIYMSVLISINQFSPAMLVMATTRSLPARAPIAFRTASTDSEVSRLRISMPKPLYRRLSSRGW